MESQDRVIREWADRAHFRRKVPMNHRRSDERFPAQFRESRTGVLVEAAPLSAWTERRPPWAPGKSIVGFLLNMSQTRYEAYVSGSSALPELRLARGLEWHAATHDPRLQTGPRHLE